MYTYKYEKDRIEMVRKIHTSRHFNTETKYSLTQHGILLNQAIKNVLILLLFRESQINKTATLKKT